MQTAISRFLAQSIEAQDPERRDKLINTSLALLSGAGVLAIILISIVVWKSPLIFHGIPKNLLGEFRRAALLMGIGACLMLPLSTFTGVLIGLHRNEFPAIAIGTSRLLGALAVLTMVRFTHSLVTLAGCIVAMNLLGGFVQMLVTQRLLPTLRIALRNTHPLIMREMVRYCLGLSVWSFTMLLVSGLDVTIVGHYRFSSVGSYSIASVLITFFAGLNQSVISALMTPVAALQVRDDWVQIRHLVLRATTLNTEANILLTCMLVALGPCILQAWVGQAYANQALPILYVLAIAQAVRLMANPYATMLAASGNQRDAILPALIEACSNLALSITGAIFFGAAGVAWGTLIGAIIGVLALLAYTVPKVKRYVFISSRDLLLEGVGYPILVTSPLLLCISIGVLFHYHLIWLSLFGLAFSVAVWLVKSKKATQSLIN